MNGKLMTAMLLGLGLIGSASSRDVPERPKVSVSAKETYHVFGTVCRGGRQHLGKYSTPEEACRAAAEFRVKGNLRVEVATGTGDEWTFLETPKEYQVFVNPCKGFNLHTTTTDAQKAKATADEFKKKDYKVEIVTHYVMQK